MLINLYFLKTWKIKKDFYINIHVKKINKVNINNNNNNKSFIYNNNKIHIKFYSNTIKTISSPFLKKIETKKIEPKFNGK